MKNYIFTIIKKALLNELRKFVRKRFLRLNRLLLLSFFVGLLYYIFHVNYSIETLPNNAERVVFLNKKKFILQTLKTYIFHPDLWKFEPQKGPKDVVNIYNSGLLFEDIVCAFQLPESKWNEWYGIFKIDSYKKFVKYLHQEKFIKTNDTSWKKGNINIARVGNFIVIGFNSTLNFNDLELLQETFINHLKWTDTQAYLNDNFLVISDLRKNSASQITFEINGNTILATSTGAENLSLKNSDNALSTFYIRDKELGLWNIPKKMDSISIENIYGEVYSVQKVKDTIIEYGYDENFNQMQQKKLVDKNMPLFQLSIETKDTLKTISKLENLAKKLHYNSTKTSNGLQIYTTKYAQNSKNTPPNYSFAYVNAEQLKNEFSFESLLGNKAAKLGHLQSIKYIQKAEKLKLEATFNQDVWYLICK